MSRFSDELKRLAVKDEEVVRKELSRYYTESLADIKRRAMEYLAANKEISYATQLQLKRLDSLTAQIDQQLERLTGKIHGAITAFDRRVMDREFFGIFYDIEGQLKTQLNMVFTPLDKNYIQQAIEMPVDGIPLSKRLYNQQLPTMQAHVQQAVTRSIIQGTGYPALATQISSIGLSSFKHSFTIARTEAGRVRSMARQEAQTKAEEAGVKLMKQWVATLDERTRDSHADMDGQIVGIDEEFESPDGNTAPQPRMFGVAEEDINCRCDTVTIVEGIAPKLRRDNTTGEIIEFKSYADWRAARVDE